MDAFLIGAALSRTANQKGLAAFLCKFFRLSPQTLFGVWGSNHDKGMPATGAQAPKTLGFPDGWDGKKSACNAGDLGLIPGLGRSPGEEKGCPLQYSCLENPMDRGGWRLQSMGLPRVRHDWEPLTLPWPDLRFLLAHLLAPLPFSFFSFFLFIFWVGD